MDMSLPPKSSHSTLANQPKSPPSSRDNFRPSIYAFLAHENFSTSIAPRNVPFQPLTWILETPENMIWAAKLQVATIEKSHTKSSPAFFPGSRPDKAVAALVDIDEIIGLIPPGTLSMAANGHDILTKLFEYVSSPDADKILDFIRKCCGGQCPSSLHGLFDQANPTAIADRVTAILAIHLRSFTAKGPMFWEHGDIQVIASVLVFIYGDPVLKGHQQHCAVFSACLTQVGEECFPLCLWLFTIHETTQWLMPYLLQCNNKAELDRIQRCWGFIDCSLKAAMPEHSYHFSQRLVAFGLNRRPL